MTHEGMTNGFSIKSWSDLTSLILVLTFILSGLVWGMKLEGRYDDMEDDLDALQRQVGTGILPRAEERVRALERRVGNIEAEHKRSSEHRSN